MRLATLFAAVAALAIAGCESANRVGSSSDGLAFRIHETRVNTFTYNRQTEPTFDADSEGNFLVAWGSRRQELGTYGVFAQLLDPLGRPIGSEVHVNQTVYSMQMDPAVAFLPDGGAWIVWRSDQQDGEQGGVIARRFGRTADGALEPLSDELIINATRQRNQSEPIIAVNQRGAAFVGWLSDHAGRTALMGRILGADGAFLSDEFVAGGVDFGRESSPAVAALDDGGFVATWARTNADNLPDSVYARVFDATGAPRGDEFVVNDADGRMHIEPAIDAVGTRFVVAWMRREPTNNYAVACRVFDAADGSRGATRVVADGDGWRSGAKAAFAPDGRFAVAWNVDEPDVMTPEEAARPSHRWTPADVYVQRFAADGTADGAPARMNRFSEGRQSLDIGSSGRQLVWTPREQLACVWMGATGQDDKRGVCLSIHAPHDLNAPAPVDAPRVAAAQDVRSEDVYPLIPPVFDPNFVLGEIEPPPAAIGMDPGFVGIAATGWNPPDPDIAVGPEHVVLVANGEIRFRTHDGRATFADTIGGAGGFWGELGADGFVFDPTAVYDPHSQRFIVMAAEHDDNDVGHLDLAVSDDSDPNGTWYKYRFNVGSFGGFLDFPNLGVDDEAIYISADFFETPAGNWVFIIPKAPTLVGDPVALQGLRVSTSTRSTGNSKCYDADAPAQYFVSTYYGTTKLRLIGVTDPLGSPALSTFDLTVPAFTWPPDADQLGTTNKADTIDYRIKNGVYRNGSLWVTHNVGVSSTAAVRWYQIDMRGWPTSGLSPQLAQTGTIFLGVGEHTWFADIGVDDHGNAMLAFNHSSASQYITVERAIRFATDAAGTFRSPQMLQTSTAPETGDRWGDYSGVDEQPNAPGTFWSHLEYRASSWRTWVAITEIPDCNGNGVDDDDDIDAGTSQDCNDNNTPDECDIASGVSSDENGDGVPDECVSYVKGDLNCDGALNAFDIDPFVMALVNPTTYAATYPDCDPMLADINDDGAVNAFDIDPFVTALVGGAS